MKSFITPTYTFTPGASGVGTVNLSGISSFDIKRLVAIINQTDGIDIYSTADEDKKYTNVAGTTVTLFFDTTGMSGSDILQIIYEDTTAIPFSATSLPLPTGAATETTLSSINTKIPASPSQDRTTSVAPSSVRLSDGTNFYDSRQIRALTNSDIVKSQLQDNAGTAITVGQKTMANSLPVVLPSDQSFTFSESKSATATLANVSASITSVTLIALNTNRLGAIIHNDSNATLYIKYGSSASSTSYTYKLTRDSTWEMPTRTYTGIITGIWTSATGTARTTELT